MASLVSTAPTCCNSLARWRRANKAGSGSVCGSRRNLVANLFEQALAQQGIQVMGRRVIGGASPATARVLAEHQSAPLQALITPLLKLSNNNMSEALLKAMGRKTANAGTAQAGVAAVAAFMKRQGMHPSTLVQVDGSGLSRRNLVSSQNLTDLLLATAKQPWFEAWYNALPIAGNADRMTGWQPALSLARHRS